VVLFDDRGLPSELEEAPRAYFDRIPEEAEYEYFEDIADEIELALRRRFSDASRTGSRPSHPATEAGCRRE
jgi:hypothetical protein